MSCYQCYAHVSFLDFYMLCCCSLLCIEGVQVVMYIVWLLIGNFNRLSCWLGFAFCLRMLGVFMCKHIWFVSTIPRSGRLLGGY